MKRRPTRKEVITAATCKKCGLCCVAPTDQSAFCDVTKEDEKRLGRAFVRRHVIYPRAIDRLAALIDGASTPWGAIKTVRRRQTQGPLEGVKACCCSALEGDLLAHVSCRVYTRRPQVCREAVVPGDTTCRQIRRLYQEALAAGELPRLG